MFRRKLNGETMKLGQNFEVFDDIDEKQVFFFGKIFIKILISLTSFCKIKLNFLPLNSIAPCKLYTKLVTSFWEVNCLMIPVSQSMAKNSGLFYNSRRVCLK